MTRENNRIADIQNELHGMLLDTMSDLVVATDLDGRIVYVNDAVCRGLGRRRDELLGESVETFVADPEAKAEQRRILQMTVKQGQWRGNVTNITSDGSRIVLNCRTQLLKDAEGKPLGLVGVSTDMTEQVDSHEALRRSEERFRTIMEASPDAIFITDEGGNYKYVNSAACRLLGYSSEELTCMNIADVSAPEEWDKNLKDFQRVLKGNHLYTETNLITKDGAIIRVDLNAILLDKDLIYGSCRDLTQRAIMEAQLRHSKRIEAIGTLAGGVAHEINNPIHGIMNYAQLIEDRMENRDEGVQKFAREIIHESERIARIVRNLLSFSRKEKQQLAPVSLSVLVEETLSLVRTIFRRDQIELCVDVPETLPLVNCRSQQIQQVIMNLVTNARDALNAEADENPNKRISLIAKVHDHKDASFARIKVEDNGPGIPEDKRERIFDPFYTSKNRAEGTGLGLSISYRIAEEHGGQLNVESKPGEWTRFYLDLPIAREGITIDP